MYDIKKYRYSKNLKVKDLIYELSKENPEACVTICGDNYIHIHCEEDGSIVTLDNEDLSSDCYEDADIDLQKQEIITHDRSIEMLKIITENLTFDGGVEVYKEAYKDLGFSYAEIEQLFK